jgi:hypothetical protein
VSESGDPGARPGGADEVGTVAEEAAKLLGVLSGWARHQGADVGQGMADAAQNAASAIQNVNDHFATDSQDCLYCPICRVVHVVRETSPEVRTHLAVAALNLMQAASAVLATSVPDDKRSSGSEGVEKIDLDDEWPDED